MILSEEEKENLLNIKNRILDDEIFEDWEIYNNLLKTIKTIKYTTTNPIFSLDECFEILDKLLLQVNRNELPDLAPYTQITEAYWRTFDKELKKMNDKEFKKTNYRVIMSAYDDVLDEYIHNINYKGDIEEFEKKAKYYIDFVYKYNLKESERFLDKERNVWAKTGWAIDNIELEKTIAILKGEKLPPKKRKRGYLERLLERIIFKIKLFIRKILRITGIQRIIDIFNDIEYGEE